MKHYLYAFTRGMIAATLLLAGALALPAGAAETATAIPPAPPLLAGYVPLRSAFQLKAYYYAYAHAKVEDNEFVRYPGDTTGKAEGATLRQAVAAAVADARAHADVVLLLTPVALQRYDAARRAFPLDNRLFVPGMEYYFDVSPYHYVYGKTSLANAVPCADPRLAARIDAMVRNYRQFNMRVYGKVTAADAATKAVVIRVSEIQLFDDAHHLLLTRAIGR